MKKFALSCCLLIFSASLLLAQDKARAIIEKAIQAQGGITNIAKLRTMQIEVEGTAVLSPGEPEIPVRLVDVWQMPDRYKTSAVFQTADGKVNQTQAIIGNKAWIELNGEVQDLPAEAVSEMKQQKYAEDLDRLGFIDEAGFQLSVMHSIEVNGKPAVGVGIKSKGHRHVTLYFDIDSGLLVKREQTLLDPSLGKEVLQEVIFSDYREQDGLKHYRQILALRDGKKMVQAKVTKLLFFDKLDDKVFAKP
jgi:hypothetical protein